MLPERLKSRGTFDRKLSGLTLLYRIPLLVGDLRLPAESCFADGADLMNIIYAQMNAARSDYVSRLFIIPEPRCTGSEVS